MKVKLIKDGSISKKIFTEIFDILATVPGKINFSYDDVFIVDFKNNEYFNEAFKSLIDFETKKTININDIKCPTCGHDVIQVSEKKAKCINCGSSIDLKKYLQNQRTVSWDTLFNKVNEYRILNKVEEDTFIILFTEINNIYNWFASLDEKNSYNGFIHTKDWDYYINCNPAFPIAFEVIALMLQKHIFNNYSTIDDFTHQTPIGCINDMCMQKKDIILKLRTADICPNCMKILKEKLPLTIINHALSILESLRKKMLFTQNFKEQSLLSRLVVDSNKKIYLPEYDNIEIDLDALSKTIYFMYLFHPEGIEFTSLCDYKSEMYQIYSNLSNRGDIYEMKSSIERLVNVNTNRLSEVINTIKRTFEKTIGAELSKNYIIKGPNRKPKRIDLDRKLVEFK